MEQKFKILIHKSKLQKEQKDPLFQTFEAALFADSSWFFHTEEEILQVERRTEIPAEIVKIIEPEKKIELNASLAQTEVLFVGDTYKNNPNSEGEDLLGKMISAMKLTGKEFKRFSLDPNLEEVSDLVGNQQSPNEATLSLLNCISECRPRVVVALGAIVTNILLGRREKLSTIHGQFFEIKANDWNYSLLPVFHPDYLIINPNMKRTAWSDLQKVMERVGKI